MIVWHSDPAAPLAPLPRWAVVAGWLAYVAAFAWALVSRGLVALVAVLLIGQAREAAAQSKPIGVFGALEDAPAWASVLTISDLDADPDWRLAADLSRTRGIVWWLKVGYHADPRVPIEAHAAHVRARLDAFGLLPYLRGQSLNEEWYEQALAGAFRPYGLEPDNPDGWRLIRDWLGRQHAALKAAIPVPVVWITTVAGPARGTFRPVPANVDAIALDPYIPAGGSFDVHVAPLLAFSERSTTLPIVLVAQFFDAPGYAPPTPALVARYLDWSRRPRVIALVAFTWGDRPALDMRGLSSLVDVREALEAGIGVAQ